jgi:hypothetical protein
MAELYRRKVQRLSEALSQPEERDEAAQALRALIKEIILTPGPNRGEIFAELRSEFETVLQWSQDEGGQRFTAVGRFLGDPLAVMADSQAVNDGGWGELNFPGKPSIRRASSMDSGPTENLFENYGAWGHQRRNRGRALPRRRETGIETPRSPARDAFFGRPLLRKACPRSERGRLSLEQAYATRTREQFRMGPHLAAGMVRPLLTE